METHARRLFVAFAALVLCVASIAGAAPVAAVEVGESAPEFKLPSTFGNDIARSLVTITSLISLYRVNEMPFHLRRALENGVTKEEIIETITHLAFYAGWPPAMTALQIARKVFEPATP